VLGRLDPMKRFDLVVTATAPLLDRARLLIVGDGTERARLAEVARAAGVSDRVVFAGERHDVAAVLSTMDLFVASSAQETFGLSVLEALANGLPALYTACPALEGISTGLARRIPGDAAGMRTEIAAELARGPRPRAGAPAEIRQRYDMPAVAAAIDDLYDRLADRRQRRPRVRRPPPTRGLPRASLSAARGETK
jgi:glycosyltransferase involved in cell wall biosynthesis